MAYPEDKIAGALQGTSNGVFIWLLGRMFSNDDGSFFVHAWWDYRLRSLVAEAACPDDVPCPQGQYRLRIIDKPLPKGYYRVGYFVCLQGVPCISPQGQVCFPDKFRDGAAGPVPCVSGAEGHQ